MGLCGTLQAPAGCSNSGHRAHTAPESCTAADVHSMQIAVEGCCHGELDNIYATIRQLDAQGQPKIDLLIICGDFQVPTRACRLLFPLFNHPATRSMP